MYDRMTGFGMGTGQQAGLKPLVAMPKWLAFGCHPGARLTEVIADQGTSRNFPKNGLDYGKSAHRQHYRYWPNKTFRTLP
jgi:hypothetical protein